MYFMGILAVFISIVILLLLFGMVFLQHPLFGKKPFGKNLKWIERQTNYDNKQFQNVSHTPNLAEGVSYSKVLLEFFTLKVPNKKPQHLLPIQKVNWNEIPKEENGIVWFGHSSYLLQLDGLRFLIDPVFTNNASPIFSTATSFVNSDLGTFEDLPTIDYLILTHDHYDHLDYTTIKTIKPKVQAVICSLGVGSHLKHWGFDSDSIQELNWNEHCILSNGNRLDCFPARHFSGRGMYRNKTLWSSFGISGSKNIFLGGDSGYDIHFKTIGAKMKSIDLAILECGQYNANWKYIHLMPGEQKKAAEDLQAKAILPVHWGKFALAQHDWKEPISLLMEDFKDSQIEAWTPKLGEWIAFDNLPNFENWWKDFD